MNYRKHRNDLGYDFHEWLGLSFHQKSFENDFSILVSTDKLQNVIAYVGNLNLSLRFEIEEILLNSHNIHMEHILLLTFLFHIINRTLILVVLLFVQNLQWQRVNKLIYLLNITVNG